MLSVRNHCLSSKLAGNQVSTLSNSIQHFLTQCVHPLCEQLLLTQLITG